MHARSGSVLLAALGVVLSVFVNVGHAQDTLPWSDRFDAYATGPLAGSGNWLPSDNYVVVTTDESYSPSKSCFVPADSSLTNAFAGAHTRVWTDMFIRPTLWEGTNVDRSVDASASALFYFNSNGFPVVYDGTSASWLTKTTAQNGQPLAAITTTGWHRVSLLHRYDDKEWALFVDNVLVDGAIGFVNTALSGYDSFEISSGDTYLDNMWVSTSLPDGSTANSNPRLDYDGDQDGLADAWELHYLGNLTTLGLADAHRDDDGDQRTNFDEAQAGTDPNDPNSYGAFGIPYYENFNLLNLGNAHGQHGLQSEPTDGLQIVDTVVYEGSKAMCVTTGASLTLDLSSTQAKDVWTDMYIRIERYAVDSNLNVDADAASAFFVNSNGYVEVYDGNAGGWTELTSKGVLTQGSWYRLIVHQDFNAKEWSLFRADNVTNALATPLAMGLGFKDATVSYFNSLNIRDTFASGASPSMYIDDLRIASMPDVVDSDEDGLGDAWELATFGDLTTTEDGSNDTTGNDVTDLEEFLANIEGGLSIKEIATEGDDVSLLLKIGPNRRYEIYATDDPSSPLTFLEAGETPNDMYLTQHWYTNLNAVAATGRRFYRVAVERGGVRATNEAIYAMYRRPRADGTWYMEGVPIVFSNAPLFGLDSELGDQLARGLTGGSMGSADRMFLLTDAAPDFERHWVNAGGEWVTLDGVADSSIASGQGLWVYRASGGSDNTVYTGLAPTNETFNVAVATGWNLLAWPSWQDRNLSQGLNFLASGGQAGLTEMTADEIFVWKDNSWHIYYLRNDGGTEAWWRVYGDSDITFSAGQGFYYYHRGGGFTWVNNYGQ